MSDPADWLHERLLILRCQTGDRLAFEELVVLYQPRQRYFLRKMLGPDRDADDLLQEIWLDVFRGLQRLAEPAAFPAWLFRIARRKVCRLLRSQRRSPQSLDDLELPAESEKETDFSAEDAAKVHAALDRLSAEHREVLLLRFIQEMSYEDIARVIDCSLGTVRSRLHYAKRALRQIIERMNPHE